MKKQAKKLALNKETLKTLSSDALREVAGGGVSIGGPGGGCDTPACTSPHVHCRLTQTLGA